MFYQGSSGETRNNLAYKFMQKTGNKISYSALNLLLNDFGEQVVSEAIDKYPNKKMDNPFGYLRGICKGLSSETEKIVNAHIDHTLDGIKKRFIGERDRLDRPILGRPF